MNLTTSELAKFSNFCRDNNFNIPIESTEIFLKYRTSKRISSLEENLKYLFYLVPKDKETQNTFKNLIYRYFNFPTRLSSKLEWTPVTPGMRVSLPNKNCS